MKSSVTEGGHFFNITLPTPWPDGNHWTICREPIEGGTLEFAGTATGELVVVIRGADGFAVQHFHSQPIEVTGTGQLRVEVEWAPDLSPTMNVSNVKLMSIDETSLIATFDFEPEPSVVLPDLPGEVDRACAKWVSNRALKYAKPSQVRAGRVQKDLADEVRDLLQAMKCIDFLGNAINEGNTFLIGHLATELRGLVF